jgi:hypothetical protein
MLGSLALKIFFGIKARDRQTGKRFEYRLPFCGFIFVGFAHHT